MCQKSDAVVVFLEKVEQLKKSTPEGMEEAYREYEDARINMELLIELLA